MRDRVEAKTREEYKRSRKAREAKANREAKAVEGGEGVTRFRGESKGGDRQYCQRVKQEGQD